MTKHFCDRCGDEMHVKAIVLPEYYPEYNSSKTVELCAYCYRALREFVRPQAKEGPGK